MASSFFALLRAAAAEIRQRYELNCLLLDMRKDAQRLKEIGISYVDFEAMVREDQRRRSPVRHAIARWQRQNY